MAGNSNKEPMLELFVFETLQLIDQLEQTMLGSEKSQGLEDSINEIFRIMHTIKGSAAMMLFNNISSLAHSLEDLFYFIREDRPGNVNHRKLTDIVLEGIDFIKNEILKIEDGKDSNGDPSSLIEYIKAFLNSLKESGCYASACEISRNENPVQKFYIPSSKAAELPQKFRYRAVIFFEDECEMENIRAFTVVHNLKPIADNISYYPADIIDNEESVQAIRKDGFKLTFLSELDLEEMKAHLLETVFLKELELSMADQIESVHDHYKEEIPLNEPDIPKPPSSPAEHLKDSNAKSSKHSFISVSIPKLDKLMDLVGELVISEAIVTKNPELQGLSLDSFHKAARQLQKITDELQDVVMSIRMVPLSATFQNMNRIVRDMSKKLGKDVKLEITGEETEVDKNIIEHISDPLIHLIRNSIDHGLEPASERVDKGKPTTGKILLEAKNSGGDVWIIAKDDGRGLDREKILKRARDNGLVRKPESELTHREIFSFIFLPGFSTKDNVTEFSGRGVGMDVVTKNIGSIGGTVLIDSIPGGGTTVSVKIPLTLAIIDGMSIKVGNSGFTLPIISIKESFRPKEDDIIIDPDGNEMILIRGECVPIIRLHQYFKLETGVTRIHEGIIIMVQNDSGSLCIFADALLGEQQVVVKALPRYIRKVKGLAGCTLLGDGSTSLILDIAGLFE